MLSKITRFCMFALFAWLPHWALAAGAAPSQPLNLSGTVENETVTLSWDASTDADDAVEGYNVYRNNAYITTVFDNSYTGTIEADTLFSFYVVAFDESPRQFSAESDSISLPESLVPSDLTIPPSVPTNLAGAITGTNVSIQWDASTDDEAVLGYNVYRNNQYLTTVEQPAYSGDVAPGATVSFYIVAFDVRRNFSGRSTSLTLPDRGPVDTTIAPEPPDGLVGRVEAGTEVDTVTLTWNDAVDDQAVAGYNININGNYVDTRFDTEYVGVVPAGTSNAFTIVAFDFDGNFSISSNSIILPVGPGSTDPGFPPSVPTGLAGDSVTANGQTTVSLTWDESTSVARVAGYNVYRNNDYLTTVPSIEFIDTVAAGQSFSYSVASFDSFGNFSALSDRLNLSGDANQPPFFTGLRNQNLSAGVLFELQLNIVDLDGGAAGVLTSTLPAGMQNRDNQDGTRSLVWTPTADDVGIYNITLTAFDLDDIDLRTSEIITLTVQGDGTTPIIAPFSISAPQAAFNLREGDAQALEIPITLNRNENFSGRVSFTATDESSTDASIMSISFSNDNLAAGENQTTLMLALDIDILPIRAGQRQFSITASGADTSDTISVTVAVTPVPRDDIYLLIGQSNMVGLSEDSAKQAGPGQADETNLRIRQLNVTANETDRFVLPIDFISDVSNIAQPRVVPAEDPLHVPVDPDSLSKEGTTIGLGLSFAKQAVNNTTRNVVLVPAAWSGTGFCAQADINAHWNAVETNNEALGNTLLFDRALARVNTAIAETGGILRGILWLQGEADRTDACAPLYQDNLLTMIEAFRTEINMDARGASARGPNAALPFIAGTLSRGVDPRGDFSVLDNNGMLIDNAHRAISSLLQFTEVSLHDDLVPSNGFECGNGSCIHYGSEALREIGVRYYDALLRASGG